MGGKVYVRQHVCSTQVFGLGDEHAVDATRRGSRAHLINHACHEPNCYSRTITVLTQPHGVLRDHVVICARRDLQVGEELVYDYRCACLPHFCDCFIDTTLPCRFRSSEVLPCTCGTVGCRGTVNCPDEDIFLEDATLAPGNEVLPLSIEAARRLLSDHEKQRGN